MDLRFPFLCRCSHFVPGLDSRLPLNKGGGVSVFVVLYGSRGQQSLSGRLKMTLSPSFLRTGWLLGTQITWNEAACRRFQSSGICMEKLSSISLYSLLHNLYVCVFLDFLQPFSQVLLSNCWQQQRAEGFTTPSAELPKKPARVNEFCMLGFKEKRLDSLL